MKIFTEEFWEKPFAKVKRWIFFIPIFLIFTDLLYFLYGWSIEFAIWLFYTGWGIQIENILGGSLSTILFISLISIPYFAYYIIQVCPLIKVGSIVFIILMIMSIIIRIIIITKTDFMDEYIDFTYIEEFIALIPYIGFTYIVAFIALIPYIGLIIGAWWRISESFE